MKAVAIFISILYSASVYSQTTITSGSELKVKGILSLGGLVINGSDKVDLSEALISLTGSNQTLSTTSPLTIQGLVVEGGGTKTMKGDWTLTNNLTLTKGILTTLTGKILYSGSATLIGSTDSYVTGLLHQRGTGTRFYPIGVGGTYMPMSLNGVQE
jgi:hypothetical protein